MPFHASTARTPKGEVDPFAPAPGTALRAVAARLDPGAAGAFALPFAAILYLALKGGGYDPIVSDQVGLAIWWIVLIGAAVGVLPRARLSVAGRVALGGLVALGAWTALSFAGGVGWTESSERSAAELARVATYLGVFVLAAVAVRADHGRHLMAGAAGAIALVAALALLSRLHPAWFPDNDTAAALPSTQYRLSYPLNYWNGVAYLVALGLPLVLHLAATGRALLTRALTAAAIPVMALAIFFTFSRGGALAVAVGLAAYLALTPERIARVPTMLLGALGSGLVIAAATQRDALEDGLLGEAARNQGDEMLAVVLVVCAGVALLQVAIALAGRYYQPRVPSLAPALRGRGGLIGVVATVLVGILLVAGLGGELSDRWQEFKEPVSGEVGAGRFDTASGSGRYQWWESSLDAAESEPLTGIGPGTFEFWWAREGTIPGFVRDAHSLYLETLAELGIVGAALLVAALGAVLWAGVGLARRAPGAEARGQAAAMTAACLVFCVAAGIDWVWELPVIPIAFLMLAGVLVGAVPAAGAAARAVPIRVRLGLVALAIVALVAIVPPLAASTAVRDSQESFRDSRLAAALEDSRAAKDAQPYAATPSMQEALVLEAAGSLDAAAVAARDAAGEEPTNWRTWYTLSRIEGERGDARASARAYEKARSLNPRSPIFAGR